MVLLPRALRLSELEAKTPRIAPLAEGEAPRPFWSVMIPTYNSGHYLRKTLESVLREDPGQERMQIEVVDGGSTLDDPKKVVDELGKGRVEFHRIAKNQGAPHTFNICLERARGEWTHLLHGDDMVMPGFYEAYGDAARRHPDARMIVGQNINIDSQDRWIGIHGPVPPVGGGILADFAERMATDVMVMCPAVVVRREAYEAVGGFCGALQSCTDWDMWFRLAHAVEVACVSSPCSLYRQHGESETKRLMVTGVNLQEAYYVISANLERLGVPGSKAALQPWRGRLAAAADETAWTMDRRQCFEGRYHQARWAWMFEPSIARFIMLVKSWLKFRWKGAAVRPAAAPSFAPPAAKTLGSKC